MKHINELTKDQIKSLGVVVFDVDGVLVPRGTRIKQSEDTLTITTKKIPKSSIRKMEELHKYVDININSGRSLTTLMVMFNDILDYISITYENGSATWKDGAITQHVCSFHELKYVYFIADKYKEHIYFKGIEPKEHILTIHCLDRILELENDVELYPELYCLWNGEAYDIGLMNFQTKANGVYELKMPYSKTLVIGDNLNDIDMMEVADISISADKNKVKGDYYIDQEDNKLPGEILLDILLKGFEN